MSTIDPDAVARAKAAKIPQAQDLWVPGLAVLLGAFVTAYSITAFVSVIGMDDEDPEPWQWILRITALTVAAGATIVGLNTWVARSVRNPRLPGFGAAQALACASAAFGTTVVAPAPAWFREPRMIPGTWWLAGIALFLGILSVVSWGARAADRRREDETMRSGRLTTGVVTNQGYDRFHESNRILTSVTYSFDDLNGTRRFVRRPAMITADDPVVTGELVDLWFDPARPDHLKTIAVRRRPVERRQSAG
ncbi:hypothetical protein [Arthrobacter woluwensis]|uniref:hypothetical protein n=1 Tax=Arthrobacter woluwensis TaxID=156980 RepID=UPI001FB9F242|nr:hypothetical protein [Arthrobacter woluwensis]